MVRTRATELAQMDGRQQFNQADWVRAKMELHGHLESDDQSSLETVIHPANMVGSIGHKVEERPPAEEPENVSAELFSEGMEEAEHDRMLQASDQEEREE